MCNQIFGSLPMFHAAHRFRHDATCAALPALMVLLSPAQFCRIHACPIGSTLPSLRPTDCLDETYGGFKLVRSLELDLWHNGPQMDDTHRSPGHRISLTGLTSLNHHKRRLGNSEKLDGSSFKDVWAVSRAISSDALGSRSQLPNSTIA